MEGYAQHRGVEDVWGVLEGRQESRRSTKADSNGRTFEPACEGKIPPRHCQVPTVRHALGLKV